jgi:hypothetical protein
VKENNQSNGKDLVTSLFKRLIGIVPFSIDLGHGSFITFDFGKKTQRQIKTRSGEIRTFYFGEWHFWVYMCAWRIDKNGKPFVGSNDTRELIREKLLEMQGKALKSAVILNDAFDACFAFGDEFELHLFSYRVTEDEQWTLSVPENKTFVAGPGSEWSYVSSDGKE